MFLHVTASVSDWNTEGTECSLVRLYPKSTPRSSLEPAQDPTLPCPVPAIPPAYINIPGLTTDLGGKSTGRLRGAARGVPEPRVLPATVWGDPWRFGDGAHPHCPCCTCVTDPLTLLSS